MKNVLTYMIAWDTCWDGSASLVLRARIGPFEVRASWAVELHGPCIGRRGKRQNTESELHFQEVVPRFDEAARLKICLSLLNYFLNTKTCSIFIQRSGVISAPSY